MSCVVGWAYLMREWEVHYNLESANYLEENGPYIYELFADMEAIPATFADPAVVHYQQDRDLYLVVLYDHLVAYHRNNAEQIVTIVAIKPFLE